MTGKSRLVTVLLFVVISFLGLFVYSQEEEALSELGRGVRLHVVNRDGATHQVLEINLREATLHSSFAEVGRANPEGGSFGGRSPVYDRQPIIDFRLPDQGWPLIVLNGSFMSPEGQLTFPVRTLGEAALRSEGYADPEGAHWEEVIENHRVLCIDSERAYAEITAYRRIDQYRSCLAGPPGCDCTEQFVSFSEFADPPRSTQPFQSRGRTFAGVSPSRPFLLLLLVTPSATQAEAASTLREGWGSDVAVTMFDGGGSSQLRIREQTVVDSSDPDEPRRLAHTFMITTPCSFPDVPAPNQVWFEGPVTSLCKDKILRGYSDGLFRPAQAVARAEFLKMVLKVLSDSVGGLTFETPTTSPFSDIEIGSWEAPYVAYAKEEGYVQGYEGGTFRPGEELSRAEMVVMAVRILPRVAAIFEERYRESHDRCEQGVSCLHMVREFADVRDPDEQGWFYYHVYAARDAGLVQGDLTGMFAPERSSNRAEAAKLIHCAGEGAPCF